MDVSGFNVKNISDDQMADKNFRKKCHKTYNHFTKLRSVVIDTALDIENFITIVILHFLVGTDYSRHELLREFIFEAEMCSFMHKRKMLSMIFDLFPEISEVIPADEGKELRQRINELVLNRDMFAHGNIFIDAESDKVFIHYYREGKKETEIKKEIVTEIVKSSDIIRKKLSKLNEFFRENRLERTEDSS